MWILGVLLLFSCFSNITSTNIFTQYFSSGVPDWVNNTLQNFSISLHEDFGLTAPSLLKKYGYPLESHRVKTEDGYILTLHRIPWGQNHTDATYNLTKVRPAVLLMHGFGGSSIHFLHPGIHRSLAMFLANAGFDVWIGNNRGNTFSRRHTTLNPDIDAEFWDFSFEKCGQYDLPAKIDYIIEKTGQDKIFFIGHSQGTTEFLAMASLRPEYNDKIALASLLAPLAYMGNISSPVMRLLSDIRGPFQKFAQDNNVTELFPYNEIISKVVGIACARGSKALKICKFIVYIICGFDPAELDDDAFSLLVANSPNGMSNNMLVHFGQNIESGLFRRFDYGSKTNMELYNQTDPPDFTLSNITAPVALYYSENDFFVSIEGLEKLYSQLPNGMLKPIKNKLWNHIDYILATDVQEYVNVPIRDHILKVINEGGTSTTPKPTSATGKTSLDATNNLIFVITTFLCFIRF